jgi:hypoxanthine-DNA glycosylase
MRLSVMTSAMAAPMIAAIMAAIMLASRVQSFSYVADAEATVLILGSMPGVASLTAGRYYAHPRNLFWPIMGGLIGAGPDMAYAERVARLKAHRIALWDVLESCVRPGSLDANIDEATLVPNDFAAFFKTHKHISRVFFNGAKAEQSFRRYAMPHLGLVQGRALRYTRLPSTSPAHAAQSLTQKLAAWRVLLDET